jgi:hypothetical protein
MGGFFIAWRGWYQSKAYPGRITHESDIGVPGVCQKILPQKGGLRNISF